MGTKKNGSILDNEFDEWGKFANTSDRNESVDNSTELPDFFKFVSPGMWPIIYAYIFITLVAAVGNSIEFVLVWRRMRKHSSAMNRLLLHLCIADLVVVLMVGVVEILWRLSVGWYAGDLLCKLVQYFRAFGLYLSSFMLICLSLDRFYAVVYPLRALDASRRVRLMIITAWICASVCALPQFFIFRVDSHPYYPAFKQCNSMVSGWQAESINTVISLSVLYFAPMLVILFSYGQIIVKLYKNTNNPGFETTFLRRSGSLTRDRAKAKTLKLSIGIIIVFIICWTPYVVISCWYIIDGISAENLNAYIQEALFLMVVANSSVNPLVYGYFNTKQNLQARRVAV